VLTLILPNDTLTAVGPFCSPMQLVLVGVMSLVLWCIFVFVQTVKHRNYFLDDPGQAPADQEEVKHNVASGRIALASLGLLLVSLTVIVLLAKMLSYQLDKGVAAAGIPQAFVGVIIAAIVLLPEGLAAVMSALLNRLQNSINLSIGSAIASIGLTIPTVATVSLLLSTLTLGTGRSTVSQGAIHLVIFVIFLLVSAVP
jgi:Ca2+:H+ antiporter